VSVSVEQRIWEQLAVAAAVTVGAAERPASGAIAFRGLYQSDLPLIFDSWTKSYRKAPDVADVPGNVYREGQRQVAQRLLDRCGALVAYNPSLEGHVFGWAVGEAVGESGALLHYVYVKQPFRRLGIGRQLVSALLFGGMAVHFQHSHRTQLGDVLLRPLHSVFNPFARYLP
jgi:GNAT superfamily N-acetyltransferase